ncbi:cadherin-like domain-containing protein [Hydrogenovibrio thermophilus]|uniref:Tandem-95 repeat protein n=1 Tax=Hydrogenovibrio thermophilus TaxID=265883 RepID=A0A451G4B4_9GAMM|nr:tandem-95 repeat protein [Hydrogenovibrio thermophilus]QAB14306.1 tandem-95 repeat protein [Hydrogenovibrio thermophilus]
MNLTVTPDNDMPVAVDDSASTTEDTALTISAADMLSNDSDIDGDTLSIDSFTQPANGTLVDNGDGTFSYTPNADYNGTDSFTYTVSDGNGGTDTATVNLTVTPDNDMPVAVDDSASTTEDTALTISAADMLSNDSDIDGDTLSIDSFTQPANGTLVDNGDGTFSYTPNADYNGTDSFTYTVSDGNGGTDTATVNLTVTPDNDMPVAVDDSASTTEDTALTISAADMLSNDSDIDGDTLSIDSFTQPANGTLVDNGDGTFSYTPNADYNGTDSFTYTVSDGNGGTDTATVNLTVTPDNDMPVAVDDSASTTEDTALTISAADMLSNDSDIDGDTLSIDSFTQPANGTLVDNGDGTFSYTPNADYNGTDSFTYTVSDGNGGTDTATVNLTVTPDNDMPVAVDDSASTTEDTALTISAADMLSNDSDIDGDTLSIDSFTQPANGTLVDNGDGTFSYTPNADYNGTDSFTYTVSDGNGGTDTATVNLTVTPDNDMPVAVDDSASTTEDTALTISAADMLSNDSDIDGDTLSIDSFTQPANGTLVDNGDGTFSYTPNADYNGTDSFTYTVSDGNGGTDTATVNLTVTPDNDMPVAVDDSASTTEDTALTISAADMLSNDSDIDGDTLSIDSFTQPANGTLVDNGDGTFSYTPNADYNGTDSFTYTVSDGNGGTDTATVNLTVTPDNDMPVAVDDSASTTEDTALTISAADMLSNDSDIDGDTLSIDSFTQPANGTLVDNGDGTFSYTPNADYNGTDSFTYTVSDGNGGTDTATVNLTVTPDNDMPVAVDDSASTTEDTALTISAADMLSNDSDIDGDTLSIDSFTQPANGTLVDNGDGTFSYTPNADYNGTDSFTYTVSDGNGGTDTATVNLTVTPDNDMPVAVDDSASTTEDTALTISAADMLSNDSDIDGDTLSIDSFTQPANGTLVDNGDGTFSYTPNADYNGTDSFTYTVSDGNGGTDTATVNLTVTPDNDMPVAVDDSASTTEDTALTISAADMLSNDSDIDGDTLSIDSFTQPANGTLVDNGDGTFSYTPNADYNGTDSFTYTVSDGNGGTDTATVNLTVTPDNDMPVAVDDSASTTEDTALTISAADMLSNDSDIDGDTLSIDSFTQPANGTLVDNGDGTFSYTPNADYNGTDSFTYTVSDGNGGTDTATVNLTVTPDNDMPVAVDDTVTLNEDAVITGQMDATDVDLPLGENLTFSTTADVEGLTFNSDGSYTFDASSYDDLDQGETQQIIIPVTVTDDQGATADATLTINVEGLNNDLTYVSEAASYHNVVGYFEVDENGLPVGEGTVVIDNQNGMTGGTHLADLDPSKEYGFFIISNAANDVSGNSTITFDVSGDTPVLLIDGAEATQPVYYDTPSFNPDGKDHFILENDGQGGTTISIEDLNLGDADFNDIVMHTNFELQNKIDVTADLAASSDTGDSSTDDLTKDNTPLITGMTESGASVVITDSSDNVVGQGVADQYGNYSITTTALPDGEQTLTVTATDVNGNEAVTTQTVTIDTVAEAGVVTVNSITDDDVVNATESGQIITVSGTATGGDISSGDLVVMTINGTDYSTSVDGDGNWHVDVSGADLASDTAFDVNVVSNDAAGNSVTTTGNSTHTVDTQAWAHIDVLTISPDNVISSSELSQNIPVIGYVKWDAKPGDPIKLYLDGEMIAEGTVSSDTNDQGFYTFSIDVPGSVLAQTDQIIPELTAVVTATDSAGNSFTASTTEVYGVDTEATPGTVTIDSVTGDNAVDTDESTQMVPISGTANGGDIQAGDEVTVTVNDQEYSTTVGSDGRWSIDVSGSDLVADADLTITANVLSSDAYGNQVESEGSRTYDLIENTAPDAQDDGAISSSLFFGLQGEYFGTNTQLSNISQFRELVENNTPDATFKAQNIDYQYGSGDVGRGTNLQTFLGSDADSLSNDPGNTSDAGIHLYGSIYLEAGTYNFKVNADDGYQIMIDGNAVAEVDYNQSSTTQTHAAFTITESGYHSIDMIWWDQGGSYVFQPELSSDGGHTYSTLDPSSLLSSENASDGLIVAEDNTLEIAPEQLLANDTDADGDSLSITDVSNAQNGQVVLNGDGSVTFTPAPDFFGAASFDYTISDGNGGTDTATVTVNVLPVNDVPVAHDETVEMDFEAASSNPGSGDGSTTTSITTNVVIALDISGSMDSDNRLELAKDALENMINAYDGQGSVNVKLVTFNSSGEVQTNTQSEVWMTAEEAINVIESLDANGYTNYEDAVYETYHNYSEPQADQTVAYFISDGEPTTERSGDGDYDYLSSWAQDGWNAFVGQYVDSLNVVALGDGISDLSYLETLAGAGNDVSEVIEVRNASELDEALTPAGTTLSVTGDLTDNVTDQEGDVSFTSISVGGVAYTASDFANGQTIALDGDGQLSVDFANGTYTYTASASEFDSDVVKTFTVNAQDEDGATVSFNVNIDVNVDDQASAPNVSLNIGDAVEVQEPVSNQNVWQGFDSKSDVITNPTYSTYNYNHSRNFSDDSDQIDIGNKSNQWIETEGGDDAVYIGNDDNGGINTGDGDDRVLIGDDANATIELEGGNDQLDIRGDADYINAGSGNDQVHIGDDATGTIELGAGDDELNIGDDSDYINAGEGNDRVYIGDEVKGTIDMGSGNDYLFVGGRLNGYIYGQSGTDSLVLDHYSLADYQNNVDGLRWKVNGFENILFGDGEVIGDSSAFASGEATSYHYALDVSASLTDQDGSETLSDVTINGLPADNSVSLQGTGVFDNGDGTYRIELQEDGSIADDVTMVSSRELTESELSDVHAAVTATEAAGGDTATTEVNEDEVHFLYGDDNEAEHFVIHDEAQSVEIENFDIEHDTLDLSEVIDDTPVDADDLSNYLNMIDNGDGTTTVNIDSDGDGDSSTGEQTQVVLDTYVDTNTDLNIQIDDQNIDYQNE